MALRHLGAERMVKEGWGVKVKFKFYKNRLMQIDQLNKRFNKFNLRNRIILKHQVFYYFCKFC